MAVQIARLLEAGRVVGSTSTAAKAARIEAELGCDAVIARADGDLHGQLAASAPIDVALDTVGGAQLEAVLAHMRDGGRVALLGTLQQDLADAHGLVKSDPFRFLAGRIAMRGYSADDDVAAIPEWEHRAVAWQRDGLRFPHESVHGLAAGPQAFVDASAGRFIRTVIVHL
nr:zinc-binding dehydrogenase [Kofleriaceae bacterium]